VNDDARRYWEAAGDCYQLAGSPAEAARCYREGGLFRRAAGLYRDLGMVPEAADMFAAAGEPEWAVWLLAHVNGDPAGARRMIDEHPSGTNATALVIVLRELAEARCAAAEGAPAAAALPALAAAQRFWGGSSAVYDTRVEEWAVALADVVGRPDQVALMYAAGVRAGRFGADHRWLDWSAQRFGRPVILPANRPATPVSRGRR
jgi:hypothetical protein